jgi:CCR4-NOT transcription complex subunit 1
LLEARPDLASLLRRALASGGDNVGDALVAPVSRTETSVIFTAIKPDRNDDPFVSPPEETSDKILFLINNLAPVNVTSKLEDMKVHFKEEHARWFANYLVDQRISTEPNNHQLYLQFLDGLGRPSLLGFILEETVIKSAVMLNAEKTLHSSSERSVLKNLGSWLGSITLARDRPIKFKNISFKDLLVEGYDGGRLIVAIPFVCKTLEPAARSSVFRPPNPWLMAVISLLVELYHFAELKLNLKFEIEVLCKSLGIELDTIEATSILRNRPVTTDSLAGPPLPDYVGDIDILPMGGYDPNAQINANSQVLSLSGSSAVEPHRTVGPQLEQILSELVHHVSISPHLGHLASNVSFKRAVQMAVDRSVREVSVLPWIQVYQVSTRCRSYYRWLSVL